MKAWLRAIRVVMQVTAPLVPIWLYEGSSFRRTKECSFAASEDLDS